MSDTSLLLYLADAILIVHVLFVLFVVIGLLAIYAGHFFRWHWVRNRLFRILHLTAIGIVVVQAWLGIICPLTTWEMALRAQGGAETYAGSFIQFWLHRLLYFNAPEWVFIVLYTGFGCLAVVSWYVARPKSHDK